ncbi:hypothetical protein [Pseudomonas mediterranea]|uniref:hypothetical protein n=1 Tax=Pseudomonas mediterranea TaxID=183795 RepID=UPI0006D8AA41|nr:hypothetical protein [Pseudomonas mediterranea]
MDKPEGFPFFMTDEDIEFFKAAGFHHVSMAEVRRFGEFGKQTIELMTANGGYWTAHYGTFWEGPKALTCQAAFVAAELEGWGGQDGQLGLARLAAKLERIRMQNEFKNTHTG